MSTSLSAIYLVRHAETMWSISGQHTGHTDLPLTGQGEKAAGELKARLAGLRVARVFSSPLQRAKRTCELAGFGGVAEDDHDLSEWDYGDYEGIRSVEIHARRPGWEIFLDGCPGGESPEQVGARADRVLDKARALDGNKLLFSSGRFLRAIGARWLRLNVSAGRYFSLDTASVSTLGYENSPAHPVIRLWNNANHVDI